LQLQDTIAACRLAKGTGVEVAWGQHRRVAAVSADKMVCINFGLQLSIKRTMTNLFLEAKMSVITHILLLLFFVI
jgi:hypothetical protein